MKPVGKSPVRFALAVALALGASAVASAREYVLVGISGNRTRKADPAELESARNTERSRAPGLWKTIAGLADEARVRRTFYFGHHPNREERRRWLEPFRPPGRADCDPDLGLIVFAYSWGTVKASRLARDYRRECGREVDLVIVLDGVRRPGPFPFAGRIRAERCWNFYQRGSLLKGGWIPECENFEVQFDRKWSIAGDHVRMERETAPWIAERVREFLRSSP